MAGFQQNFPRNRTEAKSPGIVFSLSLPLACSLARFEEHSRGNKAVLLCVDTVVDGNLGNVALRAGTFFRFCGLFFSFFLKESIDFSSLFFFFIFSQNFCNFNDYLLLSY